MTVHSLADLWHRYGEFFEICWLNSPLGVRGVLCDPWNYPSLHIVTMCLLFCFLEPWSAKKTQRFGRFHYMISYHVTFFTPKKYRDCMTWAMEVGWISWIEWMHLKPWRSQMVLQRSQGVDQWVVGSLKAGCRSQDWSKKKLVEIWRHVFSFEGVWRNHQPFLGSFLAASLGSSCRQRQDNQAENINETVTHLNHRHFNHCHQQFPKFSKNINMRFPGTWPFGVMKLQRICWKIHRWRFIILSFSSPAATTSQHAHALATPCAMVCCWTLLSANFSR